MNQPILFHFAIIHSFIIFISGCITFPNGSDGQCTESRINSAADTTVLSCLFFNAIAKINSSKCGTKKFWKITVDMFDLEDLEKFCLNNNDTIMNLLNLYKDRTSSYQFIVELRNLLLSSDRVNLTINRQWITQFFGQFKSRNTNVFLRMYAQDWSKIKLTIDESIIRDPELTYVQLFLKKSEHDMSCMVNIGPLDSSVLFDKEQWCKDSVTYINHQGNIVSWLTVRTITTRLVSKAKTRNTTETPLVESTTVLLPVQSLLETATSEESFIFWDATTTIKITTDRMDQSSSRLLTSVLLSTFIIIITLGLIIYFIMKRNRTDSIPPIYSQTNSATPTYTYNVPMYHNPPYNQK